SARPEYDGTSSKKSCRRWIMQSDARRTRARLHTVCGLDRGPLQQDGPFILVGRSAPTRFLGVVEGGAALQPGPRPVQALRLPSHRQRDPLLPALAAQEVGV